MVSVGLALPQYAETGAGPRRLPWERVVDWARRADGLGFGSLWLPDHLLVPLGATGRPSSGEYLGLDPVVALGALARLTSRMKLGPLVLRADLRPPKLLAHQLETLHDLAGDRLVVGLGTGRAGAGRPAAGPPSDSPEADLPQLVEVLDILGEYAFPRWAGGHGDRFLEVVASHADGWNTAWSWTVDGYRKRVTVLERACRRIGRDPASVVRSIALSTLVGESERDLQLRFRRLQELTPRLLGATSLEEWRTARLVGTVEEVREQVAQWRSLGISVLIAAPGALPFFVPDTDDLDLLASALL